MKKLIKGFLAVLLAVALVGLISSPVLAATLYEYYNTNDDNGLAVYPPRVLGQTFTPSEAHKITSVKLLLYRLGSPGTLTVGIRATSGGEPTGGDLCSGSTDGDTLPTTSPYEWREITLGDGYDLDADTQYAIIIKAPDGNSTNSVWWRKDASDPTYAGGLALYSVDEVTWYTYATQDYMFEEWGEVAAPPTVTTSAASSVEATTATGNGNITAVNNGSCDIRGFVWDLATHGDPGNVAPGASGYANDVAESDGFGTGAFTGSLTGLPTGDTIYVRAYAHNENGYGYGAEINFLTKPAAPTNVSATDGDHTDKVVITWTKSTGATDYHVWRDAVDLGAAGDVATFDDAGADAPTITPGTTSASDGTSPLHVTLALVGASANNGTTHTYKVVASNATGDSDDSLTDNGYRGVGALTYQWQRSAADADAEYGNITGATTDPYDDTAAPAPTVTPGTGDASDGTSSAYVTLSVTGESSNNGDGRWYQCVLDATGAAQQTSISNRGYRGTAALTYQWRRSNGDSDADYADIVGGTTDPYNDTSGGVDPDGRWYYAEVSAVGANTQDTTHDRGYRESGGVAPGVNRWIPLPLPFLPLIKRRRRLENVA